MADSQGLEKKLDFVMNEIKELDVAQDPRSFLKRFILIISALFHHIRYGGLSRKQISDLTEMAYAILRVSGIKPGKSQVSFLYGELHMALSEIHLSNGESTQQYMYTCDRPCTKHACFSYIRA